ncbi:tetratricopeptide repeat protein [Streptomyces mirabilis]|uniref:tetratricopeptide repeat protein n=1 Tax=Streptomyces mirabilis TaxID=68239 RepID=UPI0036BFDFEB
MAFSSVGRCRALAYAYQAAGDLRRAIPLLNAVLAQREQAPGDTHPSTLNSRNNLASARRAVQAIQPSATKAVPQAPSTAD